MRDRTKRKTVEKCWSGHTLRGNKAAGTKQTLTWNPQGNRRPKIHPEKHHRAISEEEEGTDMDPAGENGPRRTRVETFHQCSERKTKA